MRITVPGKDYITVSTADNLKNDGTKVHLIKFNLQNPTKDDIYKIISVYDKTNRFVISNQIKAYNDILKFTGKKFYVENNPNADVLSFFRKNNKVLLNVNNLRDFEANFILHPQVLPDVLKNIEVICISKKYFDSYQTQFEQWDGNVILT